MNLLDTTLSRHSQASEILTTAEAFAAIALLAVTSDAVLSQQQARSISFELSRLKLFSSYSEAGINKLLEKNLSILRCDGFNALFNAAKASLSPELREAAFIVATDLVIAENVITEEEKIFLNDLHQALDIPRDLAIKILQVLMLKNQR